MSSVGRDEVEAAIRSAFAGVTLGSGTSALQSEQTEAMEPWVKPLTEAEYRVLPQSETTDDWAAIPDAELVHVLPMHLDDEGLRYYLPALLIWLLDNYEGPQPRHPFDGPMEVIYTFGALAPNWAREWWWRKYDAFSAEQRAAIARYVREFPHLVQIRSDDQADLESASLDYWNQFLE